MKRLFLALAFLAVAAFSTAPVTASVMPHTTHQTEKIDVVSVHAVAAPVVSVDTRLGSVFVVNRSTGEIKVPTLSGKLVTVHKHEPEAVPWRTILR